MSVRFILGRAGTGKTHHCLEAIRKRLRADAIDGPRLILLVPEQASYQMERAILESSDGSSEAIGGAHRAEVLSFRRLAFRLLGDAGAAARVALTESTRAMVLRRLVTENADQLRYYGRVARHHRSPGPIAGFIDRLGATLAELIEEAISPDDLLRANDDERLPARDPAQRAKLHDLGLIYQAYLDFLGDDKLDPTQQLQVARLKLPHSDWLAGAELWVDGFASLSGQESLTLLALAKICTRIEITAMLDHRLRLSETPTDAATRAAGRLFSRTWKTFQNLSDRFHQHGLSVQEPLVLTPKTPPRFRPESALARLERSLFTTVLEPSKPADESTPEIEVVELPSLRVEVDFAVSKICRWVQDPKTRFRYRDIALIARDLDPYHDLITQSLKARNIPFFIDRRRPTAHHPLVELLRALVCVAREDMSLEAVRWLLKTGLLPISDEASDELENYLIAHGITDAAAWCKGDWAFRKRTAFAEPDRELTDLERRSLERVNTTRRKVLTCLDPWSSTHPFDAARSGAEWSAALEGWLSRENIGETLKQWAQDAETDGDLDKAEEHRQVFRDVIALLDDLSFALGNVPLTIGELAEVLDSGLSGLTLGLVPPTVDQVLVGSIERSRHPNIKAAVVLGFNDGTFPKPFSEESILNDDDRTTLADAGLTVRPPSRELILDEMMLAYIALTRASETVVVTYAASDNTGKALRPAPYIDAIAAAVPGLKVKHVADPIRLRDTWNLLSSRDLAWRLTTEFRSRPPNDQDDPSLRSRWNELYATARRDMARDPIVRRAFLGLDEREDDLISPANMKRIQPGPLQTSVSRLETYAACPFQYFARYMLNLEERRDAALQDVDVGQLHHAILEDFVGTLTDRREGFGPLNDGELLDALAASCHKIATRLPKDGTLSDARNGYVLRRSATDLARVIRAQRKLGKVSTARPHFVELPFGFHRKGGLPALELETPAGRRVSLRGYIDRVDLVELADEWLGIVIDYKRTRDKRLELDHVYHGLSLQLVAYLLVLGESGETLAGRRIRPIAALYQSLRPRYESVGHPTLVNERDASLDGTRRPRGLIRADRFSALDSAQTSGWSTYYSLYRKKDESVGHIDSSDAADADSFQRVIQHTREKLGQLADGILDGNVAVSPVRLGNFSPCSWCVLDSVCRYETGVSDLRFLESLKRSDVFRRLATRQNQAQPHPES